MAGKKIFIVEDDSIIKLLITTLIESMGHTIAGTAASMESALPRIHQSEPDLLILDIGLKGEQDGIALGSRLQDSTSIPFIYVTGNSDTSTIQRARLTDPLGFIFKPFDENGFVRELQNFLDVL